MAYDIVVNDDNYDAIVEAMKEQTKCFESLLLKYETILKEVTQEGIKQGLTNKKLVEFAQLVSTLKGELNEITEQVSEEKDTFLEDMDRADYCLF